MGKYENRKRRTVSSRTFIMLLALCAVLLVAATVMGTMAYLTSQDEVVNTFTAGKVAIKLDETKVDQNGTAVTPAERVKANTYKLVPGHTYTKDPTVTLLKGSETSYIKMTVTFSKAKELDAIFAPTGAELTDIFNGYNKDVWLYKGDTKNETDNTRTYEFWYSATVNTDNGVDVELLSLFESITVPGSITNEQLKTIEGMTITVNAYAIQFDGFTTPEAAWAAFNG